MVVSKSRWVLSLVVGSVVAGCGAEPEDSELLSRPSDPMALSWVAPSVAAVEVDGPVALTVTTANPDARVVRFEVDGREVGTCDPAQPEEDCRVGEMWRWTTTFAAPGRHTLTAWFEGADGARVEASRELDVVPQGALPAPTDESLPTEEAPVDVLGETNTAVDGLHAHAGFRDPDRGYHNIFGGIAWSVSHMRVILRTGTPMGSVAAVGQCMNRFGASIRRWADHYNISRASVLATAITESNCTNPAGSSDGLSSGPMQVTATTCAAITGLSRETCRRRMHVEPDFSFRVGARYIASAYQRNQHRNDPPKIAAAYNAGSLRATSANRWRMVSTGNHIDRFVQAYNAFHRWQVGAGHALTFLGPERVFSGEHVDSVDALPADAREGQTVFVGDWSRRDGQFYEFVNGRWWSTAE